MLMTPHPPWSVHSTVAMLPSALARAWAIKLGQSPVITDTDITYWLHVSYYIVADRRTCITYYYLASDIYTYYSVSRETESTVSGPGSDAENAQLARCVRREVGGISTISKICILSTISTISTLSTISTISTICILSTISTQSGCQAVWQVERPADPAGHAAAEAGRYTAGTCPSLFWRRKAHHWWLLVLLSMCQPLCSEQFCYTGDRFYLVSHVSVT